MSNNLGGNPQCMVSRPSQKKRELHGYGHFFFVNLRYHPDGPKSQGAPGLLYDIDEWDASDDNDEVDKKEQPVHLSRIFVNVQGESDYSYMGQYQVIRAAPLTAYEWASIPERVGRFAHSLQLAPLTSCHRSASAGVTQSVKLTGENLSELEWHCDDSWVRTSPLM